METAPETTKTKAPRRAREPKAGPKRPRGPARPHRRLDRETLDTRIEKLEKRKTRAKLQMEDAARHVEGYLKEREFRLKEDETGASEAG